MYTGGGDIILELMDRDIDQYMKVSKRGYLVIQDHSKLQYTTNKLKERKKKEKRKNDLGALWLLV